MPFTNPSKLIGMSNQVGRIVSCEVPKDLTLAVTADVGATTWFTSPAHGATEYLIAAFWEVTTAGGVATGTLAITCYSPEGAAERAQTTIISISTAALGMKSGVCVVRSKASGAVKYTIAGSVTGTSAVRLRAIRVL